ncbi:MAG: PAS domain S-box protein [Magnetococcus sp. DMHC-6]
MGTHRKKLFPQLAGQTQVKKALWASEARYRAIVEDQIDLICRIRPNGTLTFANEAFLHQFKIRRNNPLGRNFYALLAKKDRLAIKKRLQTLTTTAPAHTHEWHFQSPSGETLWQLWTNRAIFDHKGVLLEYQMVGRDITQLKEIETTLRQTNEAMELRIQERTKELITINQELRHEIEQRNKAEQALRDSEERFRTLVDHSPDLIMTIDRQGTPLYLNRPIEQLIAQGIVDKNSRELLFPGPRSWYEQGVKQVFTQEVTCHFHYCIEQSTWWDIRIVPFGQTQAKTAMILATDVTEKRILQAQAIRHARLASIGILAAGVAHEINNPNNAILFNAALITKAWHDILPILKEFHAEHGDFSIGGLSFIQEGETLAKLLEDIGNNAKRIERIIANLKHLAKGDSGELHHEVELHETLRSALLILTNKIRKHTDRLELEFLETPLIIKGNVQQLEQVFINIILNALQSLPNHQHRVLIRTRKEEQKNQAIVLIQDEGIGIAQEDLAKLIEPFFTTKMDTGGTGLGLSITNAIIQNHQGTMQFASQLNSGTTVTLTLPLYNTMHSMDSSRR